MKDDKKKYIVVGALAVVMAGVGAFTFMGGEAPPPVVVAEKPAADAAKVTMTQVDENGNVVQTGNPEDLPKNPLYAADLPQRDPFKSKMSFGQDFQPAKPTQTVRPVPRAERTTPKPSGFRPYDFGGSLPTAGGDVTITQTGPDPRQFNYTVSGVITGGNKPAAVFTDSTGNQRLVPVGGSLDGDSKVVSVEKGHVTIEHRGKKQRLSLGGNPK
jgi:hypothetical protein